MDNQHHTYRKLMILNVKSVANTFIIKTSSVPNNSESNFFLCILKINYSDLHESFIRIDFL